METYALAGKFFGLLREQLEGGRLIMTTALLEGSQAIRFEWSLDDRLAYKTLAFDELNPPEKRRDKHGKPIPNRYHSKKTNRTSSRHKYKSKSYKAKYRISYQTLC